MTQTNDRRRLESYLTAEAKYLVAPIPAPIDPATAIEFVKNHATERLPPEQMSKLARLAILHDLKETAPAFIAVLKNTEQKTPDYHRSAWALIALAWIGSHEQHNFSLSYLHKLQARAPVWENREVMLDATEAFGPLEGTDKHRLWVTEEIERRKSLMGQYQSQNKQAEARGVEIQIDELEEHLSAVVAAVDRSNGIRATVLPLPLDARISRLTTLYAGTEPATPALVSWAAFTLVRVAKEDGGSAAKIAGQFASLATQHERPEGEPNASAALIRARCLRAVEFFGQALNEAELQWLTSQGDPGTDILALRPNWHYR